MTQKTKKAKAKSTKSTKAKADQTIDNNKETVENSEEVAEEKENQPETNGSEEESDEKVTVETEESVENKEETSEEDKDQEEKDAVDMANEEALEWKNKYMRLSAEFDNYRKRTLKEKSELIKVANEDLLKNILPVVDDFERGIETIDKATDIEGIKEGIHLIYNKFHEFLKQNGIKEIEASEKEFDLDFHEALTKIPAPKDELKGKVVDIIEKGYTLNDKVIRYSKVVVGE
ncbi:MAG: nucleotide exchange factor GrpE [Bacteroidales bacterium]|nr:nucleotide exchange factor GrpE [Bacteroidales bacterium]